MVSRANVSIHDHERFAILRRGEPTGYVVGPSTLDKRNARCVWVFQRRVKNGVWVGMDKSESARWKTSPSKNLSLYALAGVDGTVA